MASIFRFGFVLGLLGLALILFSGDVAAKFENKAGLNEARFSYAQPLAQTEPTPTVAPPPTATATPVPPKPTPTLIGASTTTTSSGSSSSVFLVFLAIIFGGIVLAVIFSFLRLGRRR